MRILFLSLVCALLAILPSRAFEFTIESPDKGEVWPKSSMVNRTLSWSEKKQLLTAEVTFSTGNYSGNGEPTESESYDFTIPGVTYDESVKQFYVMAPNGEKVAIAQRTKLFLGSRIDLLKTATIHVARFKTELSLALVVTTTPTLEIPATVDSDGTKKVPLDSILSH